MMNKDKRLIVYLIVGIVDVLCWVLVSMHVSSSEEWANYSAGGKIVVNVLFWSCLVLILLDLIINFRKHRKESVAQTINS